MIQSHFLDFFSKQINKQNSKSTHRKKYNKCECKPKFDDMSFKEDYQLNLFNHPDIFKFLFQAEIDMLKIKIATCIIQSTQTAPTFYGKRFVIYSYYVEGANV
jgi:hypothetical protein